MRVWADVFTYTDVKLGTVRAISSASVTKALDGAGSFTLSFPATDKTAFDLLREERRVRIYVEQDEQPRLFSSGIIRDITIDESAGGAKGNATGPDAMDALTRKSVLLGRAYENQLVADIAANLIGLVPGWSIDVETISRATARFDGANVLRALIRVAQQQGMHLREGVALNTLEMGAFGEDSGIRAVKPNTLTVELNSRDDVLIIDKIKRKSSSRNVINWIIPLGAGEGTAALTMEHAVNVTPPSIEGPDGKLIYYLFDQDSIDTYGQNEKVVTFKEIVPTSNSGAIQAFSAELLYNTATAWLTRNSQPLITYSLSVKKNRSNLRPGDKIRIAYKGLIETENGLQTYLDVNELFWVMKITETVNDSGIGAQLEINTIDRFEKDTTEVLVDSLEAIEVRNVSTNMYPMWLIIRERDYVWASAFVGDSNWKYASFELPIDDGVTDITRVILRFSSEPAGSVVGVTTSVTWDGDLFAMWANAPFYPDQISLLINGSDVTSEFGGPWGTFATPAAVEIDITEKIRKAVGGMYQNHSLFFACVNRSAERSYPPHTTSSGNGASGGVIRCEIRARLVVKN